QGALLKLRRGAALHWPDVPPDLCYFQGLFLALHVTAIVPLWGKEALTGLGQFSNTADQRTLPWPLREKSRSWRACFTCSRLSQSRPLRCTVRSTIRTTSLALARRPPSSSAVTWRSSMP